MPAPYAEIALALQPSQRQIQALLCVRFELTAWSSASMKMMLGRRATILTKMLQPGLKSEQMGGSRQLHIYSPCFYICNASDACRAKTAQCRPGRKKLHASPHAIHAELHNEVGFLIQCFGYITFKGRRRAVQRFGAMHFVSMRVQFRSSSSLA